MERGKIPLGDGNSIIYTTRDEKLVKINIEVRGNLSGKDEVFAEAVHEIEVKKGVAVLSGVTADLQGLKSEVAAGGSANIGAANFRNSSGPLITTETADVVSSLNTRWQKDYQQKNPGVAQKDIPARPKNWGIDSFKVVWRAALEAPFTPKETLNSDKTSVSATGKAGTEVSVWGDILQDNEGVYTKVGETAKGRFTVSKTTMTVELTATKTTLKPGELVDVIAKVEQYGVTPPFKFSWTGEHGGSTADAGKVSFVSRKNGAYLLSVEVTDSKGLKGTASITLTVIGVTATLVGVPDKVVYGQSIPISVKVDGLDKVQSSLKPKDVTAAKDEWVLTEIIREDDALVSKEDSWSNLRYVDEWSSATHSDTSFRGHWAHPSFPITVTASWDMPPTRIKPNSEVEIQWSIGEEGDGDATINLGADSQPSSWDKQKKINDDQGYCPSRGDIYPAKGAYRFTLPAGKSGDVKKFRVQTTGTWSGDGPQEFANQRRTFVYTYNGEKAVDTPTSTKIIWQSEPGITFNPPTSQDMKTIARFDRMNKIKIWADVQVLNDGIYETVGETPQKEVTVVAPKFDVVYDPVQGKAQVGQEIKATVKTEPLIDPSLIDYAWSSPESSNRIPYQTNAGVIGFKLKDAKPFELVCTAKVPTIGEVIGTFKSTFSASPYVVKAQVVGTIGPKPQIWKEGVGLVDVQRSIYASDERVGLKATIKGTPMPSDLRWLWTVNEGTTLAGGNTSKDATVTRHETGTVTATVEARDKSDVILGTAEVSFEVTISQADLDAAKKKVPVTISLKASITEVAPGGAVQFTTATTGGKAPFKYQWSSVTKPNGSVASLIAGKPGDVTVSVTVTDAMGSTATARCIVEVYDSSLKLALVSDITAPALFDTVKLQAKITGGKAPYTVKWSGPVKPAGLSATAQAVQPGNLVISATVTDVKKKQASATIKLTIAPLDVSVKGVPDKSVFGSKIDLLCEHRAFPSGIATKYQYVCSLPLKNNYNRATDKGMSYWLNGLGRVSFSCAVYNNATGVLLGKSKDYVCEITAPKLSLAVAPAKPKVGDMVEIQAELSDPIDPTAFQLQWMRPKSGDAVPPDFMNFRFKLTDTSTVIVLVMLKNRADGTTITEAQCEVAAGKAVAKAGKSSTVDASNKKTDVQSEAVSIMRLIEGKQFEKAADAVSKLEVDDQRTAGEMRDQLVYVLANQIDADTVGIEFEEASRNLELGKRVSSSGISYTGRKANLEKAQKQWTVFHGINSDMIKAIKNEDIVLADEQVNLFRMMRESTMLRGKNLDDLQIETNREYYDALKRYRHAIDVEYRADTASWVGNAEWQRIVDRSEEILKSKLMPNDKKFVTEERDRALAHLKQAAKQQQPKKEKATSKPSKTALKKTEPAKPSKKESDTLGSRLDGVLDAINGSLDGKKNQDKPNAPLKQDKPVIVSKKPQNEPGRSTPEPTMTSGKPIAVVSVGNTGGCQYTDSASFKIDKVVNVMQIIIWYSWNAGEESVAYQILQDGQPIRSSQFRKGTVDAYQRQWGNGVDEPHMNLQPGKYTVRTAAKRIGQNSGTGGNGMIKVITGGYLVPPSSGSQSSIQEQPAPKQAPVKPAPKPAAVKPAPASKPAPKPAASGGGETLKVEVTFYNGDRENLHMFRDTEGFDPSNRRSPGTVRVADYTLKIGQTINFTCGRGGKAIAKCSYKIISHKSLIVTYKPGEGMVAKEE